MASRKGWRLMDDENLQILNAIQGHEPFEVTSKMGG